ncbi:sugar-phosphatase [Lactobacillus amylolyticus]|uniref:Cof-type HAD-IIB family hydrolase n=1 Tax=Lactobacillus amylolyticus TaxID=83683 RepID=UPI0009B9A7F6|nr:Cof-type HAD-IIB family hydrolase [Lactobacillus amylolyticus]ARD06563.1 sugar-phosphatase [Lactobacillus amylolyticus]
MGLPFKAIAVDMDGTFLNEKHDFDHEKFREILTELHQRQVKFIISSGRPYVRLRKDFADFYSELSFVTSNGARLIENDQEVALQQLARKDAIGVIDFVNQRYADATTLVFHTKQSYINRDAPKNVKEFLEYFAGCSCIEVSDWSVLPENGILEVTFHVPDSSIAKEIEAAYNQEFGQKISAFASAKNAVDVNAYGVNKGEGLKLLLEKMDLTGDYLMAFGDGGNDVEMLQFAKYSYAMKNGSQEAKDAAKYLAPANTEDGVFKVIKNYLSNN